jgi:hypothetical protein
MLYKAIAVAAAMSLLAASGVSAAEDPQSTYTLQISGYVPVICRAQLNTDVAPSAAGEISLGQMSEFCNNSSGYQVWIDYSPDLAGDTLMVDGQEVVLDNTGSVQIDSSAGPNVSTKELTLEVPQDGISGNLSIRVVTL